MALSVTGIIYKTLFISQVAEEKVSPDLGFWRDPAWQSAGVVVAIVIALLSSFIGWKQYRRKTLHYSIISDVSVLNIEESIKAKVQITYESKPIQDLYLVVVRVINSGNMPILPTDYSRPLSITLNGVAEILSAEILKESPKRLGVTINHSSQNIEISPVLLNQKDSFDLKILATNFNSLYIDGRIAGVKSILRKDESARYNVWMSSLLMTVSSGMILFGLVKGSPETASAGMGGLIAAITTSDFLRSFKALFRSK